MQKIYRCWRACSPWQTRWASRRGAAPRWPCLSARPRDPMFLSFIQSLTEAAALVPHALVIGSLPESDAEAGGVRGKEALLRLEKVFGRVQSPWLPATGDETYEIIRRRMFQALDADGERARN